MADDLFRLAFLLLHAMAGAAWFGSIFYSIFVLYPRLSRHFNDISERERFLLTLSHGARWHMVAAMCLVALSGLALLVKPRTEITQTWLAFMALKTALMLASAVLFWRVSWHWWPARLFAMEAELPALHRRFRVGATAMLVMVGMNAMLGLMARAF